MTIDRNRIVALGVAGALAIGFAVAAGPALAAPVPSNTAQVTQAEANNVVAVQRRRRGNAAPWVAGAALGIVGAVIANEAYRDRYYDDGYAYGPYPYAAPYPTERYYGGYAPYRSCDNGAIC